MLLQRRSFIKTTALASAALLTPKLWSSSYTTLSPKGNKVLVVVQLSGANDGLNTIIPTTNDAYYKARPTLGIRKDKALRLTDDIGIHPSLSAFKQLYDDGNLAIVNGVGYPDNSRSHFRSMDIWHSASQSGEYLNSGWIGRYLDQVNKNSTSNTRALEIDDLMSLALKGKDNFGLAFRDPKRLMSTTQAPFIKSIAKSIHALEHEQTVDYLYQTLTNIVDSAAHIFDEANIGASKGIYPTTEIAQNLKIISSLILSDIDTKVYYLTLNGFDTHTDQLGRQNRLFDQLNGAVEAFTKDLKQNNRFDDVLLMTFSEFGRRLNQNGSGGTDHGAASCMFLAGGGLKNKGVLNDIPSLTDLHQGDLKHTVDFKSVYATILKNWLQADPVSILNGQYDLMNFV